MLCPQHWGQARPSMLWEKTLQLSAPLALLPVVSLTGAEGKPLVFCHAKLFGLCRSQ